MNRRRRNPPRAGRAQKVIAILEKSAMKTPPRQILTPGDLVHYSLYEYIGKRANEMFLAVYLNVHNVIVGFSEYTMGSPHEVSVDPSGMFRDALLAGAAAIITVHQHPSGKARPSDADELLWERIRQIGKLIGVPIVDNIVLGEDEFYSEGENRMTSYAQLRMMMK
jgi:DNA repair protein RadC